MAPGIVGSQEDLRKSLCARLDFESLNLVLAGITSFQGKSSCCIRHPASDSQMIYDIGDVIGGFRLGAIEAESVLFERDGCQFWLVLEADRQAEMAGAPSNILWESADAVELEESTGDLSGPVEPATVQTDGEPVDVSENDAALESDLDGETVVDDAEEITKLASAVFKKRVSTDVDVVVVSDGSEARGERVRPYEKRSRVASNLFIVPVRGRLTSGYGYRRHPVGGSRRFHRGIDIGAPYGRRVSAAADGVISKVSRSYSYGRYIIVDHAQGYSTLYAHLSKQLVATGQKVDQGQAIGEVGSTGVSTGPHLHFEVRRAGQSLNPSSFVTVKP